LAQNIYDNSAFFEGYSQFPRSRDGLTGAPEWPALRAMLPALAGKRVLDLGCGFGAFCRFASAGGAAEVVGIDLSEKMLAEAATRGPGLPIRYERGDLEHLDLGERQFDVVFSSLAVHYVADFDRLLTTIRGALVRGGALVFSTEHPLYAVRAEPEFDGSGAFRLKDYLVEGERTSDWVVKGVIKHHRVISTMIRALHRAGFSLADIEEWGPSDALIAAQPDYIEHRVRPMFLLVAARAEPN
jgi:2-polyprenyl-3-methyl-5-hydroxy-6-metoxy-1,4-benzoquinol methylase